MKITDKKNRNYTDTKSVFFHSLLSGYKYIFVLTKTKTI